MSETFPLNNGDMLHLEEYGATGSNSDDRRAALVALHGLGGGGYFFAGIGRSLPARSCALCPDLPGSGFSPRGDQPVTFDRFVDAVVQLIERKTTDLVALMGHSMGAIIALKVYARIPARISSLIFVGGLPTPLPEAQARLRDRAALARSAGMAVVAPTIVPVVFARQSRDAVPDKVAMFQRLLAQSDPRAYAETAIALADASAAHVVASVSAPTLCITGAEDRYAPPAAVRHFAKSLCCASFRELPDCGHMPFFEEPDAFFGIVQGFLSRLETARY